MLKAIEFDSSNRDLHDWNVRLTKHYNEKKKKRHFFELVEEEDLAENK